MNRRGFLKQAAATAAIAGVTSLGCDYLLNPLLNPVKFEVVSWKWFTNPPRNFTTTSETLVPTNLPANPDFTKLRENTFLWAICVVDLIPTTVNSIFNAVMLDDNADLLQVSLNGQPNQLCVLNMTDILAGISAGHHTLKFYGASNGGPVTYNTTEASFKVLEVTMPPSE